MSCEKCSKEPCECDFVELINSLIPDTQPAAEPSHDRHDEIKSAVEEIIKDIEELKREVTVIKAALGAVINMTTAIDARLSSVEKHAIAAANVALLYYRWILKLLDHTGLKAELVKKDEEKKDLPPPPPPPADTTTITTQSYEPGKSEPHDGMYQ